MCLHEHNFDKVCGASLAAAAPCQRLAASIPHELRQAAMSRTALNDWQRPGQAQPPGGDRVGPDCHPRSSSVMIKMKLPPLTSALVTQVADPQTGSTVAMLLCTNSKSGRFATHDELFAEGAALHVGLLAPSYTDAALESHCLAPVSSARPGGSQAPRAVGCPLRRAAFVSASAFRDGTCALECGRRALSCRGRARRSSC